MTFEIHDVSKTYRGGTPAVASVTMSIGAGVLGLLGPNGANLPPNGPPGCC